MTTGTSPTLTLNVRAPTALEAFRELAATVATLRQELNLLHSSGGGGAAFTKINAEVKELRQALEAGRREVDLLTKKLDEQSKGAIRGVTEEERAIKQRYALEQAEIKQRYALEQAEIKKTAALKKETDAEALASQTSLNRIQRLEQERQVFLHRAAGEGVALNLTGARAIQVAATGNEQAQQYKSYIQLHEEEMAVRARAALQIRAANEMEIAQRAPFITQYRAITENDARNRTVGIAQYRAQVDNEVRIRTEENAQAKSLAADYNRTREAANLQARALRENELMDRQRGIAQYMATLEQEKRIRYMGVQQSLALAEDERRAAAIRAASSGSSNTNSMAAAEREREQLARSVTRGAAAASGGMFLTYGSNIPALAATFAGAATVKAVVQKGSEFDYVTAFTAALSDEKVGPSLTAYKEKIQKELLEISKGTQFSAPELGESLRVLEQTGIAASKGILLVPTAAKAALMGETDVKTAAQDIVAVLQTMKLRVDDPVQLEKNFRHVGDVIATIAKETQANFHEVSESMKGAIGVAGAYGVKLETVGAIVLQLGKAGITSGKAGTLTRNMIENLYSSVSTDAVQTKKELEISPFKINPITGVKEFKDDVVFIQEALNKIAGLNPEEKLVAVQNIFNERGAKPGRELLLEQVKAIDALSKSVITLTNSSGALDAFVERLSGNTKTEWLKVQAAGVNLLVQAFSGAEPVLLRLAKLLENAFNSPEARGGLREMISDIATLVGWMVKTSKGLSDFREYAAGKRGAAGTPTFREQAADIVLGGPLVGVQQAVGAGRTIAEAFSSDTKPAPARLINKPYEVGPNVDLEDANLGAAAARQSPVLALAEELRKAQEKVASAPKAVDAQKILDALFPAVLKQESGDRQFNKDGSTLLGPITRSGDRAIGRAQMMPGTGPEAARLAGVPWDRQKLETDAEYNATLGKAYLGKQLNDFQDPAKAVAAYNAGPGAVRKAVEKAGPTGNFLTNLPAETQNYVPSVLASANVASGALPGMAKPNQLSLKTMDPEEFREQQKILDVEEQGKAAQFRRDTQRIQQQTQFEIAQLEVRHSTGLVKEAEYTEQLNLLNKRRVAEEVEAMDQSINALEAIREKQDSKADKRRIELRIKEEQDTRDRIVREAAQSNALSATKIEGEKKQTERKFALEAEQTSNGTTKILAKASDEERLSREQAQLAQSNRLRPEVDVAAEAAAFATRKRFADDLRNVEAELRKERSDMAAALEKDKMAEVAGHQKVIDALEARKIAVAALSEVEATRSAAVARALKEEERSWSFGMVEAMQKYRDAATNAAQDARDLFGTATKGMEDSLTEFAKTGKLTFKGLLDSLNDQLLRQGFRKLISAGSSFLEEKLGLGVPTAAAGSAVAGGEGFFSSLLAKLGIGGAKSAYVPNGGIATGAGIDAEDAGMFPGIKAAAAAVDKPLGDLKKSSTDADTGLAALTESSKASDRGLDLLSETAPVAEKGVAALAGSMPFAEVALSSLATAANAAAGALYKIAAGGGAGGLGGLGGLGGGITPEMAGGSLIDSSMLDAYAMNAAFGLPFHTGGIVGARVLHTGGVIGAAEGSWRAGRDEIFRGARRYHGGGYLDAADPAGTKLAPNEVPIIAEKGEGVFTRKQMLALVPTAPRLFTPGQLTALAQPASNAASRYHSGGIVAAAERYHTGAIVMDSMRYHDGDVVGDQGRDYGSIDPAQMTTPAGNGVVVNVYNSAGAEVRVEQDGKRINVMVEKAVGKLMSSRFGASSMQDADAMHRKMTFSGRNR